MDSPHEEEHTRFDPEEAGGGPEVSLQRIQVIHLGLVAVASAVSLLITLRFALGVIAGGILMAVNFRVIAGVIQSVFLKGSTSVLNVGIYWVKFVGVMALIGALVLKFRVDPIGLLIGLTLILFAITAEAVFQLVRRQ